VDDVVEYVYELRQGEDVVATGRLSRAEPLEVGERVSIGGREGIVRTVEPILENESSDSSFSSSVKTTGPAFTAMLDTRRGDSSTRGMRFVFRL